MSKKVFALINAPARNIIQRMKKWKLVLRALLSVMLLGYIISRIDFGSMKGVLDNFNPVIYAGAVIVVFISQACHALVLNALMKINEARATAAGAFRALAVGTFFGMFLPGSAGPDIMLCYNLSKDSKKKENPLGAVILARALILFSSIFLGLAFSFAAGGSLPAVRNIFIAASAGILILAFITFNGRCSALSAGMLQFLKKNRWTRLFYKTYFAISEFSRRKRLMLRVLPLAVLTSFTRISVDYLTARSLGLEIPPHYFFIFVPLVSIAAVLPVSISGIGVREGAYVGLFAAAGVKTAEAFSISILVSFTGIIFALFGALVYITGASFGKTRPGSGP